MKIALNKAASSRKRYYLVNGSMGSAGESANHATKHLEVVNGIDRGHGYQGYMSVSYALACDYIPKEAKAKIREVIKENGYSI